jgi:hypothetical protein
MPPLDLAAFCKRYNIPTTFDARKLAKEKLERWGGRAGFQPHNGVCWLIFTKLLRTKTPIDAELEKLLPVPTHVDHLDAAKTCLAALPEPRQMPAIIASLGREAATEAVHGALTWLTVYPTAELVTLVLARSKDSELMPPTKARAALSKLAAKSPPIAAALAGKPAPTVSVGLTTRARSPDDLTPIQAKQLLAAAKAYDGKAVPIARRFGPDDGSETSFGSTIEFSTITLGKRTFDVVQFAGDSGSVFKGGTTKEVASILQGGVECEDAELDAALSDALSAPKKTKPTAKRMAKAKKPSGRKTR